MTYKQTTINGEQYIELLPELQKSPSYGFYETQQSIILWHGPFTEGALLHESEIEIKHEAYSGWTKSWHDANMDKLDVYAVNEIPVRRVATLKEITKQS